MWDSSSPKGYQLEKFFVKTGRYAWAWKLGHVIFDFRAMTWGICWTSCVPRYWYQCGHSVSGSLGVNHSRLKMRMDVHEHGMLVLWPLTLEPWPWPGFLVDAPVLMVLMPIWPVWICGILVRDRCVFVWNFGPVTFDLGAMSLTLGFLWSYWWIHPWWRPSLTWGVF